MLWQAARAQGEQAIGDGLWIVSQFVAAGGFVVGELQPVERGGSRQGRAAEGGVEAVLTERIELVARGGQERIAAQESVVIEILVTQGQAVKALGQKLGHRVIHEADVARVEEARGQRAGEPQPVIDLAEQEHAAVTGEVAGGKIGDDFARAQTGEKKGLIGTGCHGRKESQCSAKPIDRHGQNTLSTPHVAMAYDRSGLAASGICPRINKTTSEFQKNGVSSPWIFWGCFCMS